MHRNAEYGIAAHWLYKEENAVILKSKTNLLEEIKELQNDRRFKSLWKL